MSELIALYIDADNVCYKNIKIIIDYIKKYEKLSQQKYMEIGVKIILKIG